MRILNEKLMVSAIAAISGVLIYCLGRWSGDKTLFLILAGMSVTTLASATFWTLIAQSVIGSFILNLSAQGIVFGLAVTITDRLGLAMSVLFGGPATLMVVGYAALMFWLGRRKFETFQVTVNTGSDDLLINSRSVMPEALTRPFRCRSNEPFLNQRISTSLRFRQLHYRMPNNFTHFCL